MLWRFRTCHKRVPGIALEAPVAEPVTPSGIFQPTGSGGGNDREPARRSLSLRKIAKVELPVRIVGGSLATLKQFDSLQFCVTDRARYSR